MKFVLLFFLSWAAHLCSVCNHQDPLSVVVIGGGPAGLATAIVAQQNGADVTLIEKRESYSREQIVLLFDEALTLLENWHVVFPQMRMSCTRNGIKAAFVRLCDLESSLARRVNELGIRTLHGEFKSLLESESKVLIASCDEETCLPYDILVGADGTHSDVRKAIDIQTNQYGEAVGMCAAVLLQSPAEMSIDTNKSEHVFVRRIKSPPAFSMVFAQSMSGCLEGISRSQFLQALEDAGWKEEAQLLKEGKSQLFIDRIDIVLQQAKMFSNNSKKAILVGDSAATASFFEGRGANTAIKTAALAGDFIRNIQNRQEDAYTIFNEAMRAATDRLINGSRYLFVPTP